MTYREGVDGEGDEQDQEYDEKQKKTLPLVFVPDEQS